MAIFWAYFAGKCSVLHRFDKQFFANKRPQFAIFLIDEYGAYAIATTKETLTTSKCCLRL